MKFISIALAFLTLPALAQVPAGSSKIAVEVAPGSSVTDSVRTTDTVRNVTITRNPQDVVTITNPPVMTSGLDLDKSTVPAFTPGYIDERVKETTQAPVPGSGGAIRISCTFAWMEKNDPIVYPGQPGRSHWHNGWGNDSLDAFSNISTLDANGGVTCHGGTINKSSYWMPTLIDTRSSKPLIPTDLFVYYKNASYPANKIEAIPHGLRMVFGDPNATAPQPNNSSRAATHKCGNTFYPGIPTDQAACPPGSTYIVAVFAPQCWDGSNLDSPDHKSHMNYGSSEKVPGSNPAVYRRVCPPTHPKIIPQISYQVTYIVTDSRFMRFTSDTNSAQQAGWTVHGDVMSAWKDKWLQMWITNCNQANAECFAHLLGRDPADGKLKMIY